MYTFVLSLHSIIRWLVLLAGIAAAVRAIIGWRSQSEWTPVDSRLGLGFMIGVDVQTLLGLILYVFLSPVTERAFEDFGAAMANDETRFFAVEHIFFMILVLLLAHAGRSLPKRATEAVRKHKMAAITFALAVAAILVAIPWDRPLFRLG